MFQCFNVHLSRQVNALHKSSNPSNKIKLTNVRTHLPKRSNPMKYVCFKCKKKFKTIPELKIHKNIVCYRLIKKYCRYCQKYFD